MPFRTVNQLPQLITGEPEEVAMAICFYSTEDEDRQHSDTRSWEDVIRELRVAHELHPGATWQEIHAANNRKLAEELGLSRAASWQNIVAANNARLARLMELPSSTPYYEIYAHAVSLCAVHLGLPKTATWQEVHRTYRSVATS